MSRRLLLALVLASTAWSSGCRLCCAPYDYCGPVCDGACGDDCCTQHRAGSILDYYGDEPWRPVDAEGPYGDPQPVIEAVPQDGGQPAPMSPTGRRSAGTRAYR